MSKIIYPKDCSIWQILKKKLPAGGGRRGDKEPILLSIASDGQAVCNDIYGDSPSDAIKNWKRSLKPDNK
jgi:hypothetical protein